MGCGSHEGGWAQMYQFQWGRSQFLLIRRKIVAEGKAVGEICEE